MTSVTDVQSLSKNLDAHLNELKSTDRFFCPASSAGDANYPLCLHSTLMTRGGLRRHLQEVHYLYKFPDERTRTKRKKKNKTFATPRISANALQPIAGNTVQMDK